MKRGAIIFAGIALLVFAGIVGAAHNATVKFYNTTGSLNDSVYETLEKEFSVYIENPSGADSIYEVVIYIPHNFSFVSWGTDPGTNWINESIIEGSYLKLNYTTQTDKISGGGSQKFVFKLLAGTVNSDLLTEWVINTTDDAGGFDTDYLNVTILNDSVPPTVELISPDDNHLSGVSTLNFSCNATDNVQLVNITLFWDYPSNWMANDSANVSGIFNETTFEHTLNDGGYTWNCQACDTAGNCAMATANRTFSIDTTPPAVIEYYLAVEGEQLTAANNVFISPQSSPGVMDGVKINVTSNETVSWRITILNNSGDKVAPGTYWHKNSPSTNIVSPSNCYWNGTENSCSGSYLPDGVYIIKVNMTDYAGNSAENMSKTITIDSTPPLITFISPTPENGTVSPVNTITINVSHTEINPDIAVLYLNGVINQTASYSGTGSISFTLAGLVDGAYTYYVWLNDSAGNSNQTEIRTLTIDTTPPQLQFESPTPGNGSSQTSKTIVINISHTETNPDTLILEWNGVNESQTYLSGTNKTVITKSGLSDGTYTFYIWINDTAGNANQTETRIVTIYTPSPPPAPSGNGGWYPVLPNECRENWVCSDWSECIAGERFRNCTETNRCGTTANKPVEQESCTVPAPEPEPKPKICNPGDVRCSGNDLMECNLDGTDWYTLRTCSHGCTESGCLERAAPSPSGLTGHIIGIGSNIVAVVAGILVLLSIRYYLFRIKRPVF